MIKHPNVVELKEVLASKSKIFVILEYIKGGNLADYIMKEGVTLSEDKAKKYFVQLLSAIEHCHNLGIAHRDLKPENILLTEQNILKVSDFGLSSLVTRDQEKLLHTTCGTINYIAPEVLRNMGYDGHKADIWSLGVILYNMLSKELPFDDESIPKLIDKIVLVQFAFPKSFSKEVKDFISKILVSNPEKRMTIAEMKTHEWLNSEYQTHEPESPSRRKLSMSKFVPHKLNAVELFALLFGNVMQRMFHNTEGKKSFYKLCTTIKLPITDICTKLAAIIKEGEGATDYDIDGSTMLSTFGGNLKIAFQFRELAKDNYIVIAQKVAGQFELFEKVYSKIYHSLSLIAESPH